MSEENKIDLDRLVIKTPDKGEKTTSKDGVVSFKEIKRQDGGTGIKMAHLHLHTFHSILDGCGSVDNYVKLAKQYNHPAIAITDHGTMSGTFEFYKKCKAAGIKPIIGAELYINDNIGAKEAKKDEGKNAHQIIFVKNKHGYQNLNKLLYLSFTDGFYKRGRIKTEWLFQYKEGLCVTTSCMGSPFAKLFFDNKADEAEALFKKYVDEFGKDFSAELQMNEVEGQANYNAWLIQMANKHGVMLVMTSDVHYAYPEDAELQDVLIAINYKSVVGRAFALHARSLFYSNSIDFQRFSVQFGYNYPPDFIDMCLSNSLKIVEKCNFDFEIGANNLPKYEPTEEIIKACNSKEPRDIITKIAFSKLKQKLNSYKTRNFVEVTDELIKKYVDRLNYELGIIDERNVLDYFLINWEIIKDYRSKGYEIGPGRGSAAGCLLSWCLDITKIDPIYHDLYFERFLNPTRKCMTSNNDVLMKDGLYKNVMGVTLDDANKIQTKTGIGELVEIIERELDEGEDVFLIETANGAIVELTGDHIVPVMRNEKMLEIKVKDLNKEDFLITF